MVELKEYIPRGRKGRSVVVSDPQVMDGKRYVFIDITYGSASTVLTKPVVYKLEYRPPTNLGEAYNCVLNLKHQFNRIKEKAWSL